MKIVDCVKCGTLLKFDNIGHLLECPVCEEYDRRMEEKIQEAQWPRLDGRGAR